MRSCRGLLVYMGFFFSMNVSNVCNFGFLAKNCHILSSSCNVHFDVSKLSVLEYHSNSSGCFVRSWLMTLLVPDKRGSFPPLFNLALHIRQFALLVSMMFISNYFQILLFGFDILISDHSIMLYMSDLKNF